MNEARWRLLGENMVLAIVVALMAVLVEFDANTITDWHVWLLGLASGMMRAGAVAGLATLNAWRRQAE